MASSFQSMKSGEKTNIARNEKEMFKDKRKFDIEGNKRETLCVIMCLKGQYHHNQSRLSTGHGIGVLV